MVRPLGIALCSLAGLLAVAALGGAGWYVRDRTGMFETLCKAGLPNLSRPSVVSADELGCAILGPRQRVTGTLLTHFETSNFLIDNLGPAPTGGGFTGNTWHTPNQSLPRNAALDRQLATPVPGLCGVRLARVTSDGWVTQTPGNFGHMGIYAREFYEDRVISVGPPRADLVARWKKQFAAAGLGSCE
jgi:hypothetical protein